MWNLNYGAYGQKVVLGTRARPGKAKPKKRARPAGQQIPRKAKAAFRVRFAADDIRRKDRLQFLIEATKRGAWISLALLNQRRLEFEKVKRELLPLKNTRCYVCPQKARERHHIIPLNRGGSNRRDNLVPLCLNCHESIHPWLRKNLSMAAGILPETVLQP